MQPLSNGQVQAEQVTTRAGIRPDILTASGHYFNFIEPADNVVLVPDIAHALANVCRFAGHTREFYSVAQHSVLASRIVPPEDALAALFHDATEAYIGDVARPLKELLPDYRKIEARLQADIFRKLDLPEQLPPSVKRADLILLATEKRDLMPAHNDEWGMITGIEPLAERIEPWAPWFACTMFLDRYREIGAPMMPADSALRESIHAPEFLGDVHDIFSPLAPRKEFPGSLALHETNSMKGGAA